MAYSHNSDLCSNITRTLRPFLRYTKYPPPALPSLFPAHFLICCTCYQVTYSLFSFPTNCLHPLENRLLEVRDFCLCYSLIELQHLGQLLTHSRSPGNVCWMTEWSLLPAPSSNLSEQDGRPGQQAMVRTPCPTARPPVNHNPGDRGQSRRKSRAIPW